MKAALRLLLIGSLGLLLATCQKEFSADLGNNNNQVITPGFTVTASVAGRITDQFGDPVKGAVITAGTSSVLTDVNGEFKISNAALSPDAALVKVSKPGFFEGSRTFRAREGQKYLVEIQLIPNTVIGTINATAGGTLNTGNGSAITLPANGVVVKSSGAVYSGSVQVAMGWIDPTSPHLFRQMPGDLRGIDAANNETGMESYGMLAVELTGSGGEKLQVAPGKKATLKFPLPSSLQSSAPATIALWSFDETTGLWKQEGNATRSGNAYIADVSHFSYWNCDIAFSNRANFTATFVDQTGQPLHNIHVLINRAAGGYTGAHGIPDSTGYLNGIAPAGQSLVLSVRGTWPCDNEIYSQNIGPFTPGSNNNLGTITITLTGPLVKTLSGTAVNCAGAPVTNGYVEVRNGFNISRAAVVNGSFTVSVLTCNLTPAISYFVVDNAAGQQSTPANITLTTPATNAGSITACGTSTQRFINFTLDGAAHSLAPPTDSVLSYPDSLGGGVMIFGNSSTKSISFRVAGNTVGSHVLASLSVNTPAYAGQFGGPQTSGITVNITEVGPMGGFVAGNFSGTVVDMSAVSHTIQCNFRVRRQ